MADAEPFVARQIELGRLHGMLDLAMSGKGQVCFVAGEAGTGKTALSEAFQAEAHARYAELVIAGGACDAQIGTETPYAPFHEILAALTTGVAGRVVAHSVKAENKTRALKAVRLVIEAVGKFGPDLVGVFIPGTPFVGKLAEFVIDQAGLREKLKKRIGAKESRQPLLTSQALTQDQIIEQFVNVLKDLSARMPLLLVLDDLHWADSASIDLVFRLVRRLADCRIFIFCALRPHDMQIGRDDTPHPLEKVINEARRLRGEVWLDLTAVSESRGREFVDALIDTEPNHLGQAFRDKLYAHTEGHPLFTVELIRDFRSRGVLKLDDAGALIAGAAIDWSEIPARVEGVVAARLSGLPAELRELLDTASAEGHEFTAELVAKVARRDSRDVVRHMSGPLQNALQIVRGVDTRRIGPQRLSRYRFSHQLVQKYLYDALDDVERAYLHESIGLGLEALYGERAEEIAPQLARHFEAAGMPEQARRYLFLAAEQAAAAFAHESALDFFNRAMALIPLNDADARIRLLSGRERVYNMLGRRERQKTDLDALHDLAARAPDAGLRLEVLARRARMALDTSRLQEAVDAAVETEALAARVDDSARRVTAMLTRARAQFLLGDADACRITLEDALPLSRSANLPALEAWAVEQQGILAWSSGDFAAARARLEEALAMYRDFGNRQAEWSVLNNMGIVATEQRNFTESGQLFEAARAIVARIGLRFAEARLLVNEGDAAYDAGDWVLSRDCARRALEVAIDVSDPRVESIAGGNLAETLIDVGDYDTARPIALRALAVATEIGFQRGVCACRESVGRIHLAGRQADAALAEADSGARLALDHKLRKRYCSLMILKARALSVLGRVDEALAAGGTAREAAVALEAPALVLQADAARAEALLRRAAAGDAAAAVSLLAPELGADGTGADGAWIMDYPVWTQWVVLRALVGAGDDRQVEVARSAVRSLRIRAGRISDLAMRRGFVDDVPEHSGLQRLCAEVAARAHRV